MGNQGKAPKTLDGNTLEFTSAFLTAIPRDADPERVKQFIQEPRRAKAWLRPVFKSVTIPTDVIVPMKDWHAGWPKFWRHFGFHADEFEPLYPEKWSIVMPKGLTNTDAFNIRSKMAPSISYLGDLEKLTSVREPDQDHVVYVEPNEETDAEYREKSAQWVEENKIDSTATRESCVLHARYYAETGRFLNADSATLDAGSRYSVGSVPNSYWSRVNARFVLDYYYVNDAIPYLGIRRVYS